MWRPAAAAIRWPFAPMSAPRCRCCKPRWVAPRWPPPPRPSPPRVFLGEPSRSSNPMAFRPEVGPALPMLQTAMGRAWLAAAPETLRREVLALLRRHLPAAWAQWRASVGPAIEHLQRHGFCVSHADWQSDVS